MKGRAPKRSIGLLIGTLLLALVFVCNSVALLITFRPQYFSFSAGDIATENIRATKDGVDYATTDAQKQAARDAVENQMRVNDELVDRQVAALIEALDSYEAFLVDCRIVWDENAIAVSETQYRNNSDWRTLLSVADLWAKLEQYSLTEYLDTTTAYTLLDLHLPMGERKPNVDPDITIFKKSLIDAVQEKLTGGLQSDQLEAAATDIRNGLPLSIPTELKNSFVPNLCAAFLTPTMIIDIEATEQARVAAANEVENVTISKGDIIVYAQSEISDSQIATMTSLGMIAQNRSNTASYMGMIIYTLCIYAAMWMYLAFFDRRTLSSWRTMLSFSLVMVVTLGLCCALVQWQNRIAPVLLAPLLMAALHDKRTAMAVNVLSGLGVGVLMGANMGTLFNEQALVWVAVSIVMGQFAITLREHDKRRSGVLLSGLVSGAVGGLMTVSMSLINGDTFLQAFTSFGLVFAGGLIATIVALGLTVLFEMIFDIPTDARLNELLNTNQPLLKKLMTSAPGTYHHCMMVAELAENAAESIHANALLAKVGATYHDVGKLRRPHMFSENQGNASNPHDALPPIESAKIIIAHQQDAEGVLQKFHMPAVVIQLAKEHHGNTLVAYFYNKAQKGMPNRKLSEEMFRYDAPKPSSIESAIIMMADSCEAAVRSLGSPSIDQVKEMTHRVIRGKMDDGQFDQCGITLQQIAAVESSFINTFSGILHDRISYSTEDKK